MGPNDSNWKVPSYNKLEELLKKQFVSSVNHDQIGAIDDTMGHQLYDAVRDENEDVKKFLGVLEKVCGEKQLDCSTVLHQVTPTGDSLLHVAAEHGRTRIGQLLVDNNFLLIVTNNRKDTALHVAARAKNIEAMRVILSKFDDASSKDNFIMLPNKFGNRALHEAILSKHHEGFDFLLSEQSESSWPLYWEIYPADSPIYVAVQTGDVEILHRLLQIPFPSDRDTYRSRGNSPLFAAISKRNTTLLKEIVADEKQQLLYLRDEHGNTPLHYAAYSSYVEGVRELLTKSNLVAFQRNLNGDLPIHIACRNRHVQVVKELLSGGWPYTRIWLNNKGQNILHIAAESGQNDMVKFLLKHSDIHAANVNEKDLNGDAPLHLASRKLHLWTLLHLSRDERIDVNLVNDQSLTARDIVWMQTKYPRTGQELLARMILKTAGIPLNKNLIRMPRAANKEWNVKDGANSLITVAVLIATVTFAAGFTVPGGFYSSDDNVSRERGRAVLADQTFFKIFMAFNTVSMYCSTFSTVILLWMHLGDRHAAENAYSHAKLLVVVAVITMTVAFMAAMRLVVSNNTLLANVISFIGWIFISLIFIFYFVGFYPLGIRLPLFRQVGELSIRIIIILFHGSSDYWIYRASEIYQNDQNGNANHGNLINPVTHHVDDLLAI